MKNKILFIALIAAFLSVNAQEKTTKFAVGLQTNFFSVPLSPPFISSSSSGVYGVFSINNNLNLKLGFEEKMLQQTDLKEYEKNNGGMLGLGYFVYRNPKKDFSTELILTATNAFENFSSFNKYHADLGVRFFTYNAFYIGTGIRFSHDETANFITSPTNSYNWYCQVGLQLSLGK